MGPRRAFINPTPCRQLFHFYFSFLFTAPFPYRRDLFRLQNVLIIYYGAQSKKQSFFASSTCNYSYWVHVR